MGWSLIFRLLICEGKAMFGALEVIVDVSA